MSLSHSMLLSLLLCISGLISSIPLLSFFCIADLLSNKSCFLSHSNQEELFVAIFVHVED